MLIRINIYEKLLCANAGAAARARVTSRARLFYILPFHSNSGKGL
jgi:hypothetical protein